MAEAIRLGGILAALMPDEPEVLGLEALMLLQASRTHARTGADGELVLLEDQDRSLWDRDLISRGVALLDRARRACGARGRTSSRPRSPRCTRRRRRPRTPTGRRSRCSTASSRGCSRRPSSS